MTKTFLQLEATAQKTKNLVIMLHGVGSDADDLISIASYMQNDLPETHFISLNGIQKYDMAPFGYQWFSLQNRDEKIIQIEISKAVPVVVDFIKKKLFELNLSFNQLFLVGFSQGTMVATHIATSFNEKIGGIVGFAGTIIPQENFTGNNHTPICLIHGLEDEVLKVDLMRQSANYLKKLGFSVETHEIPFLTHSIDMKCIKIATNFIKNHNAA